MKKSKASLAAGDALGDLFEGLAKSGVLDECSLAADGFLESTDGFLDSTRANAPKYPEISVKLIGENGNAFAILGRVRAALRSGGVAAPEVTAFLSEATSGDYNHLLQTVVKWLEVT